MSPTAWFLDYDGVVVDSQPAKNASWTLGGLQLRGELPKRLIGRLLSPKLARRASAEAMRLLRRRFASRLQAVAALAGLSRVDTREAVWKVLMDGYQGPKTSKDLEELRNKIKDPLINYQSRVMFGTIAFLRAASAVKLPCALVTQAKLKDVRAQAKALDIPLHLFDTVECAGDYELRDGVDGKALAYARACRTLGHEPTTGVSVEDADGGMTSAKAAGLRIIGLRDRQNTQSMKSAALVVASLAGFARRDMIRQISTQDAETVIRNLRSRAAGITIASTVGGTKIWTAEVKPGGEIGRILKRRLKNVKGDLKEEVPRVVAGFVKQLARSRFVETVGVCLKGPLRFKNDDAWVGPWVVPPYDVSWPFERKLRIALSEAGVVFGHSQVVLDSIAALKGEMHPRGTLANERSGAALIWGTGLGISIQEKGKSVREIGQDEQGNGCLRVLTSIGRHVVHAAHGYEYRTIPRGHSKAILRDGEEWMSERLAGAWLARVRVAGDLLRADVDVRRRALLAMEASGINLQRYVLLKKRNESVERRILSGLTRAALKGNRWAIGELSSIGSEFGEGLAAFVWSFRKYEAVKQIVLVSTIAERLGTGMRKDVLMVALRKSMESTLIARGMDKTIAHTIASGVRRSRLGSERELLAFD